MKRHFIIIAAAAISFAVAGADSGRAPLMGWSSWNTYHLNISDQLIREQADAMVNKGLKDAGYSFINIDDGFWNGRGEDGKLIIDAGKFPNGMRAVADYIHSLGLKAGIYSDAGDNTCGSGNTKPYGCGVGLYNHEVDDIHTYFIDWDYDFIKVDYCGGIHLNLDEKTQYNKIADAIKNCGKEDLHFNVCRWAYPGTWIYDVADSWRTTGDITNTWESVKSIIKENLYLSAYCRDGHYNDMDMLEVGRGMTAQEDLTHFAMWCAMSSPLLIGCDMRNMSQSTIDLITNPELIALNQDPLHLQAYVAYTSNGTFTLVKDLEEMYGKTRAIIVYNPEDGNRKMKIPFSRLELGGEVQLRDLVTHEDLGTFTDTYQVTVPGHGVKVFKATATERLERTRYEGECGYISDYQETVNNEVVKTGIYSSESTCSGGRKAGWLGYSADNDLRFDNVYSKDGGTYKMTIAFLSGENRNINVEVNGEPVTELVCNSGSYNRVGLKSIKVKLNPGVNTVRFYNADYFMPDIDYFDLAPDTSGIDGVGEDEVSEKEKSIYNLAGVRQQSIESPGVYIVDGKKVVSK